WVAASPMPGASYMVSNMSSNRRWASSLATHDGSTGAARVRRRGSGNSRIGSRAMAGANGRFGHIRALPARGEPRLYREKLDQSRSAWAILSRLGRGKFQGEQIDGRQA